MSWSTSAPQLRRAAALGQMDFWALRPWRSPDEEFLGVVDEALREWSRTNVPPLAAVRVVGEQWSARTDEIQD